MQIVRTIIVEDHFLVRIGLKNTFQTQHNNMLVDVVGEAGTISEFYELIESGIEADLVLLDIHLPDGTGVEIAHYINKNSINLKILALSAENSITMIEQVVAAKVGGFISKSCSADVLFSAIDSVMNNIEYYGKDIAALLHNVRIANIELDDTYFTPKELEVLKLAAEGFYSKEIGSKLSISAKTVSVHKTNIFKKLGINNSVELVKYAIRMGFVKA